MRRVRDKMRLEAYRLPKWLSEALDGYCSRGGIYKSEFVRVAIEFALRQEGVKFKTKACKLDNV